MGLFVGIVGTFLGGLALWAVTKLTLMASRNPKLYRSVGPCIATAASAILIGIQVYDRGAREAEWAVRSYIEGGHIVDAANAANAVRPDMQWVIFSYTGVILFLAVLWGLPYLPHHDDDATDKEDEEGEV